MISLYLSLGHIQKYLHHYGIEHGLKSPPVPALKTGHKVAIIGSGPAGLACARELARKGSEVTIFESRADSGGALRYALSPFRVDHALVNEEVDRVREMGVSIQYNTEIADVTQLQASGFHDVFVSSGLQRGKNLPHLSATSSATGACLSALTFLEYSNEDDNPDNIAKELSVGKTVTVVGGGSVAMDCAVTAIGLGAKDAYIIAMEKECDFPADEEEIALALSLGVKFKGESRLVETQLDKGFVVIETKDPSEGSTSTTSAIDSSCVIMAIGQETDETSRILLQSLVKPTTQDMSKLEFWPWATKEKPLEEKPFGLFYGGDVVRTGGDIVVRAVADGKRAAASMLPATRNARRVKLSLQTDFCGLTYENPFCLSSSVITDSADVISQAYDLGWAGSYFNTLARHPDFRQLAHVSARPLGDCMNDIQALRTKYPSKVTAVGIMGYDADDWAYLAGAAEGAGAQLIELSVSSSEDIERFTSVVKRAVSVPVTVKLLHNNSDNVSAALAAQEGGANGISAVCIPKQSLSRYAPLKGLPTVSNAVTGFSGRETSIPLTSNLLTELMYDGRLHIDVSGMGGLYTWKDGVEYMALGASNLQVATAVSQYGPQVVEEMIDGLERHLSDCQVVSVREMMKGHKRLVDKCGHDSVRDLLGRLHK